MEKDFDYYVPFPVFSAQTPTLIVNPDSDLDVDLDLEIPYPLKSKLIEFEFCEPYPKKPAMVDYMFRSGDGILSEKINQALSAMNIKGIQLIPATIANPTNREIYGHYYFLHIHNYLECMDKEKSVYTLDVLEMIEMIDKLVLDEKILSSIPLEERLIFRLGELYTMQIFHKSVVDAIMATNPQGIRFVNVKDFNMSSAFD